MMYLFSRPSRDLLEMFAWSNMLLALDYDGTLAPLVNAPERATMRRPTRTLLKRAAGLYPCLVISGRAQADALKRVRHLKVCRVIGNHGAEPGPRNGQLRRCVRRWVPMLAQGLSNQQGVVVEDKGLSLAVHYRSARERTIARAAILEAVRALDGVRIIGGKLAINLVPADAPHKGLALQRECTRFGCDTVIYVGDDETDEDVFRLDWPGRLLSVRVGQSRRSSASYYIRNQSEIDRFLTTLIALRNGGTDA